MLRVYQKQGFDFLFDRAAHGVGAVLADDMGLGKTLQILALLTARMRGHAAGQTPPATPSSDVRALVICPASVVAVWLQEAEKFCPWLRCAAFAGPAEQRTAVLNRTDWDVLVTNYALIRQDADKFASRDFAFIVLDEAQQIKNPAAQITRVVKQLRTACPIALTGTPLENRLLDLWSIIDFLNPGFLGSEKTFLARYEQPQRARELARQVRPIILRRTKEAVAPELPLRTEETLKIELTEPQREIYDLELMRARQILREKGPVEILAALTRLRQLCCHPQLVLKQQSHAGSAKLDTLREMVVEVLEEGHSMLVFSQFASMLELIREDEGVREMPSFMITGRTPAAKRAQLVRQFNESAEPQLFLLSLKAAGTGLTLTKADYVFLFDPWWNPAVERQAIDRTHRIGQEKPVIAYRLVAADTVEEKVQALQKEKEQLFAEVMADSEHAALPQRLDMADIKSLLE